MRQIAMKKSRDGKHADQVEREHKTKRKPGYPDPEHSETGQMQQNKGQNTDPPNLAIFSSQCFGWCRYRPAIYQLHQTFQHGLILFQATVFISFDECNQSDMNFM